MFGTLHVIGGNDRGKQFSLSNGETTIGRGADQAVILADIAASRRHCVIAIDGERYRLRDLGSGNGTLVNGVRQPTVVLNDGDQIEVGNTILRFEHPPSRAGMAPGGPSPLHAAPDNKTMLASDVQLPPMPAAPSSMAPPAYTPPPAMAPPPVAAPPMSMGAGPMGTAAMPAPGPSVFDQIAMPPAQRPPQSALPAPLPTGMHGSPGMSTGAKIGIVAAVVVVLGAGGALVAKKFLGNDGAKKFADAQVLFTQKHDYDAAKKLALEAVAADASLTQAAALATRCDDELKARVVLEKANAAMGAKKWSDAVKLVKTMDPSTQTFRQDGKDILKQAVPNAVDGFLSEARELMKDDPAAAQAKVDAALEIDPDNDDAQDLDKQLKSAMPKDAVADAGKRKGGKGGGSGGFALVPDEDPIPSRHHAVVPEPDAERPMPAPSGGVDVLTSPAAQAYKTKDFGGAAAQLRSTPVGKQLEQLAAAYATAESDKNGNPAGAIASYTTAMNIDARIGHGYHGAYFKRQLGSLEKAYAMQAFQQSKYDAAFDAVRNCAKYGVDDGGVGRMLSQKAAELNAKASAMKSTNVNAAKGLWRTVVRMVPPSDPSFVAASRSLTSTQAPAHTDEDE